MPKGARTYDEHAQDSPSPLACAIMLVHTVGPSSVGSGSSRQKSSEKRRMLQIFRPARHRTARRFAASCRATCKASPAFAASNSMRLARPCSSSANSKVYVIFIAGMPMFPSVFRGLRHGTAHVPISDLTAPRCGKAFPNCDSGLKPNCGKWRKCAVRALLL